MFSGSTLTRSIVFAALVSLIIVVAGCGDGVPTYDLVPVTGIVKLNGTPLADADVQFVYEGGNAPPQYAGSTGKTDPNGKYELVTNAQKGCVEGKFKVVISKWTDAQGNTVINDPEKGMDLEQMKMQGQAVQFIPPAYSSLEQTKLTADVSAGKADGYDFELTK